MDQYEKSIREKVFMRGILTPGEWIYLVGVFVTAREHDDLAKENDRLRNVLSGIAEYCSGDDRTLGAIERLMAIRNTADQATRFL